MLFGRRSPTVWNIMVIIVAPLLETYALSRKTQLLENDMDSQPSVDFTDRNTVDRSFVKSVDDNQYEMLVPNYSNDYANGYPQIDHIQREDRQWNQPDGNHSLARPSKQRVAKLERKLYADFNQLKMNNDLNEELDPDARSLRSPDEMFPLQDGTAQGVYLSRSEHDWTGNPKTKFGDHLPVLLGNRPPVALSDRDMIALDNHPPIALSDRHMIALENHPPITPSDRPTIALDDRSPIALGDQHTLALDNRPPTALGDRSPIALSDRHTIALGDRTPIALDDRPLIVYNNYRPIATQAPPQRGWPSEKCYYAHRLYSQLNGARYHDSKHQHNRLANIAQNPHMNGKPKKVGYYKDRFGNLHRFVRHSAHPFAQGRTREHRSQFRYPNYLMKEEGKKEKRDQPMPATTKKPESTTAVPDKGTAGTNRTSQNGTKSQDDNVITTGNRASNKGSQLYQVMAKTDRKSQNGTVNGTASSGNNTADEETKKNMLKEIISELEGFKPHPEAGSGSVVTENTPCSILGSWISDAGGVRFDIGASSVAGQLNISIAKTIPPKRDPWLNGSEWSIEGEVPFTDKGVFTLTAVHKTQHRAASFIGQCVRCGGEELVAGVWSTGRAARDCRDTIVAYGERPDVFRREVLHILRAQRQRELAREANATSTAAPVVTTEPSKKVKRGWDDSN